MILKTDSSIRKGWTTPYFKDGSGWTGQDELESRQNGWWLRIEDEGILVGGGVTLGGAEVREDTSVPRNTVYLVPNGTFYVTNHQTSQEKQNFNRLLERAMTGDELSYKALYLMVYNDPEVYGEFAKTVEALKETYATS